MGKLLEWHFGGRSSSRRATTDHPRRRHRPSLPSCMSTLFHFFDFRSSHFTHIIFDDNRHTSSFDLSNHRSPLPKASHNGVEAPRNSLDLDEASISCLINKEENLQLQMGLQIKTRKGSTKLSKARSEQQLPNNDHIIALESPSAKTPNLLARLMGLDNLPQPSSSSSYCRGSNLGTHSLPESPRVSSTRLSDVDYHHRRLSLQMNLEKENIIICDDNDQIKRKKEKVRRRVALVDITNNNKRIELEKQEILSRPNQNKVERSSKKLKKMVADESSSSRVVLRNQEVVSKKQKLISMSMQIPNSRVREGETFDCPKSNNHLNHSTIFPIKKEPSPATKVPPEKPCSYYPKGKTKPTAGDRGERNAVDNSTTTHGGSAKFKHTIKTMKSSTHINSNWFQPLTFHPLETAAAVEEQRWNRRLVLHLVEYSVGGGIVNKSWHVRRGRMKGWELGEEVKKKKELPRAKSEVVEIKDLEKSKRIIMEEETEGIVKLIELHIIHSLLQETVALISPPTKHSRFANL